MVQYIGQELETAGFLMIRTLYYLVHLAYLGEKMVMTYEL